MSELTTTQQWLSANNFAEIGHYSPVGGGCINNTGVITLTDGKTLFLKQHDDPPTDFFSAEAQGLRALTQSDTLRVPKIIRADPNFLLLEDLGTGPISTDYWTQLGEQLADLHATTMPSFGFPADNYCGLTPQSNTVISNGHTFFGENRLLALATKAVKNGLLQSKDLDSVESLVMRLPELIPDQPPVLIHGDLWSGNVHCDKKGQPALIDPACYWGWAEAEISMTILFGGFEAEFYGAYESASNIAPDWRQRAELYNLYHLLNHLVLFGASYLGQVRAIINNYR